MASLCGAADQSLVSSSVSEDPASPGQPRCESVAVDLRRWCGCPARHTVGDDSMPTQGSSCVGPRLDDVPKRAWLPNSPTTQEPLDGRSMRHVQSSHPGRFGQAVAAASRQLPKTTRRVYRSAPTPCMSFFSRLRASASTWSFQRCVVHSGLLELVVAPDSAVIRLACDDSIGPGRSRVFRPRVGTALDVDMSHLRSVVAGAVIKTAMSDCAGLSGATRLMAPG
jgi:hypothetical protein